MIKKTKNKTNNAKNINDMKIERDKFFIPMNFISKIIIW